MGIVISTLIIFGLSLAVAFALGGIVKLFGKAPNWQTLLAIAFGVPAGHLVSDLLSLSNIALYVAIGSCTTVAALVMDLAFKPRRQEA